LSWSIERSLKFLRIDASFCSIFLTYKSHLHWFWAASATLLSWFQVFYLSLCQQWLTTKDNGFYRYALIVSLCISCFILFTLHC
jgi:hypothetical protein